MVPTFAPSIIARAWYNSIEFNVYNRLAVIIQDDEELVIIENIIPSKKENKGEGEIKPEIELETFESVVCTTSKEKSKTPTEAKKRAKNRKLNTKNSIPMMMNIKE